MNDHQSSSPVSVQLLPCPFCGAPARTDLLPPAHGPGWVQCSECECDQHMSDTLEEAVTRWNTRAPARSSAGIEEINQIVEQAEWYASVDANAGLAFYLAKHWPQIRAAIYRDPAQAQTQPRLGGIGVDWWAESVKLYRQNQKLRKALKEQHDWHLAQGEQDFGDGIKLNMAGEYADSGMYERTVAVLDSAPASSVTSTDRSCTCHPSEAPVPCQEKYAFSECQAASLSSSPQDTITPEK